MFAEPNRGQQRRRAESPTQSNVISQQLETILNRLTALEQQTTSVECRPTSLRASTLETSSETGDVRRDLCEVPTPTERPLPSPGSTAATKEVAEKFLEAITSLTAAVKLIAAMNKLQPGRVAARTLPRQERPC
ncbi:unnamed protein product [Danaus chrysippus]|uniref:(African queen) hypothetical protein n=1 Tax=Danaus chrysippus TaxID=151541 RepID=A0A8J2QNV5_9NEOP|nr:unnamed protein product [Danaus chrysippus]